MSLESHEYASLFPMMGEDDLSSLKDSIQQNGLREPIIIFENQILDGRNRYKACEQLGVTPSTKKFSGDDPLQFVLDHNLHRRHLTESQRAMVAASLANLRNGSNRFQKVGVPIGTPKTETMIAEEAAKDLNIGRRSVFRAKTIQRDGSEKLISAVNDGEISVNAGSQLAKLSEIEQDELVEAGPDAVKARARDLQSPNPSKPAPVDPNRVKIIQEIGIGVALTAINSLKRIGKDDTEREEALKKVLDYCQDRLDRNI